MQPFALLLEVDCAEREKGYRVEMQRTQLMRSNSSISLEVVMEKETDNSALNTWPTPVNILESTQKYVRLNGLPVGYKQRAWAAIKDKNPALAELLRSGSLKEIVEMFDADILIEAEIAPFLPVEILKGRKG